MNANTTNSPQDYDLAVQAAFDQLLTDYLNSNHRKRTDLIIKAFNLARTAHENVKRKSGEPYIMHPIAVASIVCNEIGLGSTSITAALLHDVVEDTDYTVDDMRDMFGETVARIVDGLTKLSGEILANVMQGKENGSKQLENIRHLLLTANSDIRIILVKIADRLHNMRTLESMPETKQAKIAAETKLFYSPLAERLGMYTIMTELQDLSFKFDHPADYQNIRELITESGAKRTSLFEQFYGEIKGDLDGTKLDYEIQHRMKSAYSIYNKMATKSLPFSEIYDIFAIRIIFEPETATSEYSDCFRIYQIIASHFQIKEDRIRDWLTRPKENGYRALHITVMGPTGEWVEVQIRSRKMHEMAERGLAAHWRYKQNSTEVDKTEEKILGNVRALLSNPGPEASDDYETMMYKFASQDMIIFTNDGRQIKCPQNFTVLDLAYLLDVETGTHCLGAKVNHVMVNIDYRLQNGDLVEILTTAKTFPKEEWLYYVTSPGAKRHIKDYLSNSRTEQIKDGRKKLSDYASAYNFHPDQVLPRENRPILGFPTPDDLLLAIDTGEIQLSEKLLIDLKQIKDRAEGDTEPPERQLWDSDETEAPILPKEKMKELFILKATNGKRNYIRATCCKPILGEEVHGILNRKHQVVVHKKNCPAATWLRATRGDDIVSVAWGPHVHSNFGITVELEGANLDGFVYNVIHTLRLMRIPLMGIDFTSNKDRAIGTVTVRVNNIDELGSLIQRLREENDLLRIHQQNINDDIGILN